MHGILAPFVFCIAVGTSTPPVADLAWRPATKTKVEKTFVLDAELRTSDVKMRLGDQDFPFGPRAMGLEMDQRWVFDDELEKLRDDRPERLVRTFRTIDARHVETTEADWESSIATVVFRSGLEGRDVIFAWDDEAKGWRRFFAGGEETDQEELSALVEDVDFRRIVPGKPVATGSSWDIDPRAFDVLFLPGGDLGLKVDDGPRGADANGPQLTRFLAQHLKGSARGTLRQVCDKDGTECAVLQIEARLLAEGSDEPARGRKLTAEAEIKVTGEILWDLEAHRAHSADLRSDLKAHLVFDWSEPFMFGGNVPVEVEYECFGTANLVAEFRAR